MNLEDVKNLPIYLLGDCTSAHRLRTCIRSLPAAVHLTRIRKGNRIVRNIAKVYRDTWNMTRRKCSLISLYMGVTYATHDFITEVIYLNSRNFILDSQIPEPISYMASLQVIGNDKFSSKLSAMTIIPSNKLPYPRPEHLDLFKVISQGLESLVLESSHIPKPPLKYML